MPKYTNEQVDTWIELLACARRRSRQDAAHGLAETARVEPDLVRPHIDELVDALYRPEAQTRWEVLDAMSELLPDDAAKLTGALEGAETSLFDEASAIVRLAAFRFLSRMGSISPERSD